MEKQYVKVIEKFNLEDLLLSKNMCTEWRDMLISIAHSKYGLTKTLGTIAVNDILNQLDSHSKQKVIKWLEDQHLVKLVKSRKKKIVYVEYKDSKTGKTDAIKQSEKHDSVIVKARSGSEGHWYICEIDLETGTISLFPFYDESIEMAKDDGLDLKCSNNVEDEDEAYVNVKHYYKKTIDIF